MFTDGGSIPRPFWVFRNLSPWGYAPAFLVHDWEFDVYHCELSEKTFDEVNATMMEGVRTLMETGICPKDRLAFAAIYAGISSPVGRMVWDRPGCTLPGSTAPSAKKSKSRRSHPA